MKLNKKAFGLTLGLLWALAIFLVTNYILLMSGRGEMLSTFGNFYPGFSISFFGSIIGLIWGFVYGFVSGWIFALLYNYFAKTD